MRNFKVKSNIAEEYFITHAEARNYAQELANTFKGEIVKLYVKNGATGKWQAIERFKMEENQNGNQRE